MGAETGIEWADATFNPWVGCTKVSPACDHCYAEAWAKRTGQAALWQGERRHTSEANWKQPVRWNLAAGKAGVRMRVFCASLADVFDNQVPGAWLCDLWDLIWETPHLDWMLLTKRPQNIEKMLPVKARGAFADWGKGWPNVWLGTTVENQAEADRRIPHLLVVPAAVRFLSCEPLLGPLDLGRYLIGHEYAGAFGQCLSWTPPLDWIIAGGESGPGARPMHPDWARSLRDQCAAADVPFFFKQWGKWAPREVGGIDGLARHWTGQDWRDGAAHSDETTMLSVGKKAAGALLDGRKHREFPDA